MFRTRLAPKLAIVLLLLFLLGAPLSGAAQSPLVRIAPTLTVVPIGGTACADLRVEDVENLFGFETVIRFDPSRVTVVDASPETPGVQVGIGPFLQPANPSNWYVINAVDNASGTIRLAITLFAPETGRSGSGVLATACFQGVNRGHSALTIVEASTLLLDPHVSVIPFAAKSGGALVGPVHRFRIPLVSRGR
jgi:hypothetical protein